MRLFLAAEFRWSPDTFETVYNPRNCEIWVLRFDGQRYVLSDEGSKPYSARKVRVHYKDGTEEARVIKDYLSMPQPRTEFPILACRKMDIDPQLVSSIDWWNGKFRSAYSFSNTGTKQSLDWEPSRNETCNNWGAGE